MVNFSAKLLAQAWPEWQREYINYEELKHQIDLLCIELEQEAPDNIIAARRNIFQGILDNELEKAPLQSSTHTRSVGSVTPDMW